MAKHRGRLLFLCCGLFLLLVTYLQMRNVHNDTNITERQEQEITRFSSMYTNLSKLVNFQGNGINLRKEAREILDEHIKEWLSVNTSYIKDSKYSVPNITTGKVTI